MGKTELSPLPEGRLVDILRAFIELVVQDPELMEFARGRRLSSSYTAQDAGLEFYLDFEDGRVSGGIGAPGKPAHVRLAMSAETLDRLFSGTLDGKSATLSGRIKYNGSVSRGLQLQVVQSDLRRLYLAARQAVLSG